MFEGTLAGRMLYKDLKQFCLLASAELTSGCDLGTQLKRYYGDHYNILWI